MIILNEGRGAFSDFPKYREMMTNYIWFGTVPEQSGEDKVKATQEAIGKPAPEDALAEARALREAMNAQKAPAQD